MTSTGKKPASRPTAVGRRFGSALANLMAGPWAVNLAFVLILLLAAWFRFHGLNWDEGRHIHPDERFLSSVTNDLKWPSNLGTYFDPAASTLSPFSLPNVGLFVYGTLPVYIVKWIAIALDMNNYDKITLVGRALSGLFDLTTIFMLFLIARRLYGKGTAVLAAGLLALSVFNIQLSHFYAVDTYANLFIVATMYFLLVAIDTGRWTDYVLIGLMLGLGLASKVSALTLAAPILVGIGMDYYRRSRQGDLQGALEQTVVRLLTVVVFAAVTFRVAQPIAFGGPSFWNWSFNQRWVRDMTEQQKTVSGLTDQPWIQQWTDRSFFFPLYNIVVWGLGLPLGLVGIGGYVFALIELLRRRRIQHLLPLVYVTVTFTYHAATFVKFMRYFLPIYPFLILFGAYLIVMLWQRAFSGVKDAGSMRTRATEGSSLLRQIGRIAVNRPAAITVGLLVVGGTLLYAIGFSSIYSRTNTRVAASRWMYANIPPGMTLANEHWDDWLPIGGLDGKRSYGDNGQFKSVEMGNYEDDTPAKLDKMVENLTAADYVILSSNRLYDSIPRLPIRYPMTTRYYQLLFAKQLGFDPVAVFTSYPRIFGIQIPDQMAEESFSVYDHPKVQIFRKSAAFDPAVVRQALSLGIDWGSVIHLTPLQVSKSPDSLLLSSSDLEQYRQAATTSSVAVRPESLGSRIPLLAWFIVLGVIGVLALPITFLAFLRFADRGYILSKALGLLLAAWGAWMLASLRIAPFTWWLILAVIALMGMTSAILAWRNWPQLRRFLQTRWRLLIFEEALFWLFFGLLLYIRLHNPDLWHPGMGGEKPMDFAYLNAIVRTPYFPSYDPWFAGGYINYYYFGFVLVAALVHLTGIVPSIAYNLAVPTFFAMTAAGAFSVALNIAQHATGKFASRRSGRLGMPAPLLLAGVCGAAFVVVIGNLAQVKLLWDGILAQSTLPGDPGGSVLGAVAKFTDGLNQWIGGKQLPIHTDWWYWNATRVIPAAQGEAGPINEMPFFTFLFGDLHAHAMALPYTLLALAFALVIILDTRRAPSSARPREGWDFLSEVPFLALVSLAIGALWPMNTWDFPTYLGLIAAALTFRELGRRGRLDLNAAGAILWRLAVIVAGGFLLFLPFHQHYASAYFGAEIWKGSRSPFWAYLLIHGFFIFILTSYMLSELFAGAGHNALVRSLRLNLRYWRHPRRLHHRFTSLTHPKPGYRLAVSISQVWLVPILVIFVVNPIVGLVLGLGTLAVLLLWSRSPAPRRQFVMFMIGTGLFLTGIVEFVVLKGDISRMNTVFKFYLQVWVMWGVASAAVLPELARRLKPLPLRESPPVDKVPSSRSRSKATAHRTHASRVPLSPGTRRWWWAFGVLLAACLLYPLTAAPVRVKDRFENSSSVTLDGTAYMRTSVYTDDGRPVVLEWDRQATEWLRANVRGLPTILEANTPLYRWGSRVSIYTGFPTVIGWDWHQKQQRSVLPGQLIDRRIENVRTLYNTADLAQAEALLDQLRVDYVYVGQLERYYYDPNGLAKFEQPGNSWNQVYQNDQVKIYQVR